MISTLPAYTPRADLMKDRVVMITGAGSGIGAAIARAVASHAGRVVLCGRTVARLEHVYDEIVAAGAPQPVILPLDLEKATRADYVQAAAAIQAEFGQLDALLHNAGVLGQRAPLEHYDPMTWHRVLHINLSAAFLLTRELLPLLRHAEDASILFTSSSVGREGRAYWGAYAVSKFATEGLMQVLAEETREAGRIRVNSINPGATRTSMRRTAYPGEDPATVKPPEALASAYLYLLGPDSRGVTGQTFDAEPGPG